MDSAEGCSETAHSGTDSVFRDTSFHCPDSARGKPSGELRKIYNRTATQMRHSTLRLSTKAMASLKAVRAAFSKRYPSLETYIDHVFSGYEVEEDGFLNIEQLAMILKSFHREFAIEVSIKDETLLAEYFVTLCSGEKCAPANVSADQSLRHCGKNGLTKPCFIEILKVKIKQDSESFSRYVEADFGGEETIQGHVETGTQDMSFVVRYHHRTRLVIQWLCATIFMLLLAAVSVWIMISPDYKSGDFWSLYSSEIIVARIGAGLAISGTFFCLLFINMYFVNFLLNNKIVHLHIQLSMRSIHKFYAVVILIGGLIHTVAWFVLYDKMANNESWVNENPESSSLPSFGASKHSMWGLCTSYVSITGYVLLGLLVFGYTIASKTILCILKMAFFVPRSCSGRLDTFDAFYWSHIVMAVSFFVILLLHPLPGLPSLNTSTGSIAWVFLALPILLYLAQTLHLTYNRFQSRSHIISSEALPGEVTRIEFPIPRGMRPCNPGQYVQISIGAISQLEVHPFTLSGCPGNGILRLHIKALGDWTRCLYQLATHNKLQGSTIHAMGPFTTRSNEVTKYNDIILVGAGIGATPFTSILEHSLKHNKTENKSIYFNWLVREQQAAQTWFHDLIQSIEDSNGNLNIRATIWYTGGKVGDSPVQKALFNLSEEFFREAVGRDLLTGIRKRNSNITVRFGRPCWDAVIRDHIRKHTLSKRLGVFCCGPNSLVNSLKKSCSRFSSLTKPIDLHSEHFNAW